MPADKVKPARVLIGGPAGCVGYTDAEIRVLDEILRSDVATRSNIVHRALRIMCQSILAAPGNGYPGSLWELQAAMGEGVTLPSSPGSLGRVESEAAVSHVAEPSEGAAPDWLTGAPQKEAAPAMQEALPASDLADGRATEGHDASSEGDVAVAEDVEDDPNRQWLRNQAAQFIG